jgi:hypothetical protein
MAPTIPSWLPLLIPVALIQLGLAAFALVDLVRRERVKAFPKWAWALVILFFGFLGPLIYLVIGREE